VADDPKEPLPSEEITAEERAEQAKVDGPCMAVGNPVTSQGLKKGALGCVAFLIIFPFLSILLQPFAVFGWRIDVYDGWSGKVLTMLTIVGGAVIFALRAAPRTRFASQEGNPSEHESLPDLPVSTELDPPPSHVDRDAQIIADRMMHGTPAYANPTDGEIAGEFGTWMSETFGARSHLAPNYDTLPYPAEEIDGAIERLLKTREVSEEMKKNLRGCRMYLYLDPPNPEADADDPSGGKVKAPLRDKLWPKD
jgi:hypothetical protein